MSEERPLVLVIEDEKNIVDILSYNLKREGYAVEAAFEGESGLEKALSISPDLILLDVMLPKKDGYEICRALRSEGRLTPVIMLTAREEEADKIFGLDLGADDYITKPFSMKELLARVRANLRRQLAEGAETGSGRVLSFENLKIDTGSMEVTSYESKVSLSQREYELLVFLASNSNSVFSRQELMEKVWNYGYYGDLRTVDVTVRRLREKIEKDPAVPRYIITRRSVGYMFNS